jgi:hypothetical protein
MNKIINGTGVRLSRKYPAITIRVEMLGRLNDRLRDARNNRDRQALKKLVKEYEDMGLPHKAEEIRLDLQGLRKPRVMGYASGSKRAGARP